jgi:uncharacterized protein YqhQ
VKLTTQDVKPVVRRVVLVLIVLGVSWGVTDVVPFLRSQGGRGAVLGGLLLIVLQYVTSLEPSWGLNTDAAVLDKRLVQSTINERANQG